MRKFTSPNWILSILTLLSVILWLFFSYIPANLIALPTISLVGKGSGALFQVLALICFILFVLLQLTVVHSTIRMLRRPNTPGTDYGGRANDGMINDGTVNNATGNFKLNLWSEIFWTILPLVTTLGLAFASYQAWISLRFL
ncbi:hypothetical protein BH10CHL1_BH10CHL1_37520 [soil metagenome]